MEWWETLDSVAAELSIPPEIKKYRKKPVVIEAMRWDGKSLSVALKFCGKENLDISGKYPGELKIKTLEGIMTADIGDYIIRGVKGEFYPCKPDIFELTYEEATDDDD